MDRWKSTGGKSQRKEEKRREEERRSKKRSLRRKKIQVREKVGKSQNTVFSMTCGFGGSKSRLAKAAGAEPVGQMRDEKLYAVVARSTFPSQNVQNTSASEHF